MKGDRAIELRFASRETEGDGRSYALSADTLQLPTDFGKYLAAALTARVVLEAAPAYESSTFG